MSKSPGLTHILTELSSLDVLTGLLKRSSRLKYTCISVSKRFLALGSNNGGIYLFSRETLKCLHVISDDVERSPVTTLALSPTEQHIGVALSNGFVAVFHLNIDKRTKPERVQRSYDHCSHVVTSLTWDVTGTKQFVGDDHGRISVLYVPNTKGKQLFALPSEVLADLDYGVFQMTWWQEKLLVSTLVFCYLFDTTKHTYSTIGTKKREGEYGACIFLEPNSQCPVIYCARPGSRMWEVDFDGNVLNTHQFKQLLAVPPIPLVSMLQDSYQPSARSPTKGGLSVGFNKMIHVGHLILTWTSGGLYLFDPINVKVMIWTDSIKDIKDVSVTGNDIYVFHLQTHVTKLTLVSIYQAFQLCVTLKKWTLMADLVIAADQINIRPSIMKHIKNDLLDHLINGLIENNDQALIEKIQATVEDISESSVDSLNVVDDIMGSSEILGYTRLPSGMIIVNDGSNFGPFGDRDARAFSPELREENRKSSDGNLRFSSPADFKDERASRGLSPTDFKDGRGSRGLSPIDFKDRRGSRGLSPIDFKDRRGSRGLSPIDFKDRRGSRGFSPDGLKDRKQEDSSNSRCLSPKLQNGKEGNTDSSNEDRVKARKSDLDLEDSSGQDRNETLTVFESNESPKVNTPSQIEGVTPPHSHTQPIQSDENLVAIIGVSQVSDQRDKNEQNKDESEAQVVDKLNVQGISQIPEETSRLTQTSNHLSDKLHSGDKLSEIDKNENEFTEISLFDSPMPSTNVQVSGDVNTSSVNKPVEGNARQDKVPNGKCPQVEESSVPSRMQVFANIKVEKGTKESIAETMRPGKRKRKKKSNGSIERCLSMSQLPTKGQLHTSLSCSDLSEKVLYSCCDDDELTFDIESTTDDIDSSDQTALYHRKVSMDSSDLLPVSEVHAKTSVGSVLWEERKEENIPPLIDRLAAAKVPTNLDGNVIDGDTSTISSFLSIKDGFKTKLKSQIKTQTKSLITIGRTLLVKNPSFGDPHSLPVFDIYQPAGDASLREDEGLESKDSLLDAGQGSENVHVSEDNGILPSLTNEIQSLCLKATKIEKKLKSYNLLLNPSKRIVLLDEWARALNQVSQRYHALLCEESRDQAKEEGSFENSGDIIDSFVDETAMQDLHDHKTTNKKEDKHTPFSSDSEDSLGMSYESDIVHTELGRKNSGISKQNHSSSAPGLKNSSINPNGKDPPVCVSKDEPSESFIPVEYLVNTCQVTDPFHLPSDQLNAVQNLTTLCFLSGITGDFLQTFHLSESSQQMELLCGILPENLNPGMETPFEDSEEISQNSLPSGSCGESSEATQSQTDCTHSKSSDCWKTQMLSDLHLALFLRLHFHAIDYARVKQHMDRKQETRFLPWIALVQCCQGRGKRDIINTILADNQINSAIDYLRSGFLPHPSSFLGHIYSLFERTPAKTSEFCGEKPSCVSAIDIIRLCHLKSRSPVDALLRYGKKVMIDLAIIQRPAAFEKFCEHQVVRFLLLESLLPFLSLKTDEVAMGDNLKSLAIQLQKVLPAGWLQRLLGMMESDDEREHVIQLGVKFRNWKLCLTLLADSKQRNRMFRLIACIGNLDLLQGNCLPQTIDEWQILFKHCIDNRKRENKNSVDSSCLSKHKNRDETKFLAEHPENLSQKSNLSSCVVTPDPQQDLQASSSLSGESSFSLPSPQAPISWNDLGRCMLQHVSGVAAVGLLLQFLDGFADDGESLDLNFLNACYTDFRVLMDQDHICHEALDRMSVYMWTKQASFLPPSVHHIVQSEAVRDGRDDLKLQSMISRLQTASSDDFMEEHGGNHWGSDVDLQRSCPSCNISLYTAVSIDFPGVVVFSCGHAFHKRCVGGFSCPFLH